MDHTIALENLILARDALTAVNVRYFLVDGTLLGIVRNGSFIEWDIDIDVAVLAEDFTSRSFARYASLMRSKGFTCQFYGVWGKCFVAHWNRRGVRVDNWFYFRRGDRRIARGYSWSDIVEVFYPAYLIEERAPIDFSGEIFMAPKHKEAVLSHAFGGDWRIPKKEWDWRSSPPNIIRYTKTTKLTKLLSYLTCKALGHRFRSDMLPVRFSNLALALRIRCALGPGSDVVSELSSRGD